MERKRALTACIVVALIGLAGGHAVADVMFLPSSFTLGSGSINGSLVGTQAGYDNFGNPVTYAGTSIGTLDYSYANWTGTTGTGLTTGGAALAGGFYQTNHSFVPAGWSLDWVQVVTATNSGTNSWGAAPNTPFPDTSGKSSPNYPYQYLPITVSPAPTVQFQDFPNRYPILGAQSWSAELGLVLENSSTDQLDVIGTFDWGFGINTSGAFTPDSPTAFGTPSAAYMTTLETDFNGVNGTSWSIEGQSVPEPPTFLLASVLGVMGLVAGYRRRKRAAA